jgi:hypothetical protein
MRSSTLLKQAEQGSLRHCRYGPKDKSDRVVNITPDMETKSQKYDLKGKNVRNGRSIKRGCKCCFVIRRLYYLRDIAEIVYFKPRHSNEDGFIVHGEVRNGDHSRFALHISPETREFVIKNLLARVPIARIMSMHIEMVLKMKLCGTGPERNHFLREWDIWNIAAELQKNVYQKHDNDAELVRLWMQANQKIVFYYKELVAGPVSGELHGDNMPFVIGIQDNF